MPWRSSLVAIGSVLVFVITLASGLIWVGKDGFDLLANGPRFEGLAFIAGLFLLSTLIILQADVASGQTTIERLVHVIKGQPPAPISPGADTTLADVEARLPHDLGIGNRGRFEFYAPRGGKIKNVRSDMDIIYVRPRLEVTSETSVHQLCEAVRLDYVYQIAGLQVRFYDIANNEVPGQTLVRNLTFRASLPEEFA